MWFNSAIGSDKVKFMFDNELILSDMILVDFFIERQTDLKLKFICRRLPAKIPKKWVVSNVSSFFLVVKFGDVFESEIIGRKYDFTCSPSIISAKDRSEIIINSGEFKLHCVSKFLTIESITACL